MDENWFIFKGDHHLGPFTMERIVSMYQSHQLNENVLLWKEGQDGWKAFKNIPELVYAVTEPEDEEEEETFLPPELPPLPAAMVEEDNLHSSNFESEGSDDPFHYLEDFIGDAKDIEVDTTHLTDSTFLDPHKDNYSDEEDSFIEEEEVVLPDLPDLPDLPTDEIKKDFEKDFSQTRNLSLRVDEEIQAKVNVDLPDDLPSIPVEIEEIEQDLPEFNPQLIDVVEKGPPEFETRDEEEYEEIFEPSSEEIEEEVPQVGTPSFEEEATTAFADSDTETLDADQSARYQQREKVVQVTMGVLCLSMIMLTLYMFYDSKPPKELFIGLNPTKYKTLKSYLRKSSSGSLSSLDLKWAVDRKGEKVWMAFNKQGPARLHLSLKSIPNKVLGADDVVVTSHSKLYKGVALFSRFDIIEGVQFYPGRYKMVLQVFDTSLGHRLKAFLKTLPLVKALPFVQEISGVKEITRQILIYSGSEAMFKSKLAEYQKKEKSNLLKPFKYQLESMITLDTLLEKLIGVYSASQPKWKKATDVDAFYKIYTREISPILQGVILDHIRLRKKVSSNKKLLDGYDQVIKFGKSIGALAADMLTKSKKNKTLQSKRQNELKKQFLSRSDTIKKEGVGYISSLKTMLGEN